MLEISLKPLTSLLTESTPESKPRHPSRRLSQVEQRTLPGTLDQSPNVTPRILLLGLAFLGLFGAGLWWANSRPAKPQPAPTPSQTTRTPAQNLAILSGKPADDPATATALARLDALCPENDAQVADLLVNLQGVLDKAGKHYELPYLMEQLAKAQEGSGQSCVAIGTALSLLLER